VGTHREARRKGKRKGRQGKKHMLCTPVRKKKGETYAKSANGVKGGGEGGKRGRKKGPSFSGHVCNEDLSTTSTYYYERKRKAKEKKKRRRREGRTKPLIVSRQARKEKEKEEGARIVRNPCACSMLWW